MRHPVRIRVRSAAIWAMAALLGPACAGTDGPTETSDAPPAAPVSLDLWDGVPPLDPQPDDVRTELEPRPGPLLPKSVGETIEVPFPPELGPDQGIAVDPPPGPLAVERFGPTGEQTSVDAIRVSFNEAMVPLSTVDALEAHDVPVVVDPPVDATAQWLGTRTVALMSKGRLPFSTEYRVTVPTTATSVHEHSLTKPLSWTFSTPTLALQSATPSGKAVTEDATVVLTFNQAVQRVALAGAITLRGGGRTVPLELLPEALSDDASKSAREREARILRLEPKEKLRKNTKYVLEVPAGVFGEGPRKSAPLQHRFETYGPLKLTLACRPRCSASQGIQLSATNPLMDPKLSERVTITPPVDNFAVNSWWQGISLSGDFEGNAKYKVEVDGGLTDTFGQTLGRTFVLETKLGPLNPSLTLTRQQEPPLVIESGATPSLRLRVAGLDEVDLKARAVQPTELHKFASGYWDREWDWRAEQGTPTFERTFDVADSKRKARDLSLPLQDMLGAGGSIGWFIARSNPFEDWGYRQRAGLAQPFEVTDLGIASVLDHDSGMVAVHRLSNGKPVAGATVTLYDGRGTSQWTGDTDADGITEPRATPTTTLIVVHTANDAAYLPVGGQSLSGVWSGRSVPLDRPNAFFFTERAPYKPGETVHLVGVLRQEDAAHDGTLALYRDGGSGEYRVTNPRGVEVASGSVTLNETGTFVVDIETKEEHGTGNYAFQLEFANWFGRSQRFYHSIPVETFRTPEFEVDVQRPTSTPLVYGDTLGADVIAKYLHGAPMVGADVSYTLTRTDSGFTPPRRTQPNVPVRNSTRGGAVGLVDASTSAGGLRFGHDRPQRALLDRTPRHGRRP